MPKPTAQISGKNAVDCEEEVKLFGEFLSRSFEARLCLVEDSEGRGKTVLLQKLEYVCRRSKGERIPVSRVNLEDLSEDANVFQLVHQIRKGLGDDVAFPTFDACLEDLFEWQVSVVGKVDARDADIADGGTVIGAVVNVGRNPEREEYLKEKAIAAFIEDLKAIDGGGTVVILLDSVDDEKTADLRLTEWILWTLIERIFLDSEKRPSSVVLVIAGRSFPDFPQRSDEIESLARTISDLGKWTEDDVREFLAHKGVEMSDSDVSVLHQKILDPEFPISRASSLIYAFTGQRV